MNVTQLHVKSATDLTDTQPPDDSAQLVLVFGATHLLQSTELGDQLRAAYPSAQVAGCTTSGEITADGVADDSITVTAMSFEGTRVRTERVAVATMDDSLTAGRELVDALDAPDLQFLLVLSDGLAVNGSSLVAGVRERLRPGIPFSGGLAGDADRFERTLTLDREGVHERSVLGIGFYGDRLRVGTGSMGGWSPFGADRVVTRAEASVVFEIDGKRALDIYSTYLGDEAKNLPASGLLFPLALDSGTPGETGLIRTLLAVDHEAGSLTFAGDVPEGRKVRLMHADFDQLVEGAEGAADKCMTNGRADLALLISCVGRKLLLGNNIDFEVDAVSDRIGHEAIFTGFYSYGEIGPFDGSGVCELHNQTMTIALLSED